MLVLTMAVSRVGAGSLAGTLWMFADQTVLLFLCNLLLGWAWIGAAFGCRTPAQGWVYCAAFGVQGTPAQGWV